jgi:hypothetical protein
VTRLTNLPSLSRLQFQPSLPSSTHNDLQIPSTTSWGTSSSTPYSTLGTNHNTIYSSLNSPAANDIHTRFKKDVMDYQDAILNVLAKKNDTWETGNMEILGFTRDEILEFEAINSYVSKGRNKLLSFLKEHGECETQSVSLAKRVDDTKEAIRVIKYNMFSLEDNHASFKELSNEFMNELSKKETAALEELQSEQAITEIRKDNVECAIKYLLNTYNILKSTSITHICPICLVHEIDTFIDPCGHTLCNHCSTKLSFCHMCRTKVKIAKSMYFS